MEEPHGTVNVPRLDARQLPSSGKLGMGCTSIPSSIGAWVSPGVTPSICTI